MNRPVPFPLTSGASVRVVDGPFSGLRGVIRQILAEREEFVVEVTVGNRPTQIWLDFGHVEAV